MEIKVVLAENGWASMFTGGESAVSSLEITVEKSLPVDRQRLLVIHAILENFFPSLVHDKIDDLCDLIEKGLDQVNEGL